MGAAVEDAQVVVDADVRLQVVRVVQVGQDALLALQSALFVALVDVEGGLFVQQDGIDGGTFHAWHGKGAVEAGLRILQLSFAHQVGGPFIEAGQEGIPIRLRSLGHGADRQQEKQNEQQAGVHGVCLFGILLAKVVFFHGIWHRKIRKNPQGHVARTVKTVQPCIPAGGCGYAWLDLFEVL